MLDLANETATDSTLHLSALPIEFWAVAIPAALGCIGIFQWWLSYRNETRKRDVELYSWSRDVIAAICAVEAHCRVLSTGRNSPFVIDRLAADLIGLTDIGRLFFPNQKNLRPRALDEVIRAYRAADIVSRNPGMAAEMPDKLRQTSRDFVVLLQKEMSRSLRRAITDAAKAGDAVGWDPSEWFPDLDEIRAEVKASHPNRHVSAGIYGQGELATMDYQQLVNRLIVDRHINPPDAEKNPNRSS